MSGKEISTGFDPAAEDKALRVEIDCITPPSAEQLSGIRDFIRRKYGNDEISFVVKKDPSVKGGFKIFVGDDNYDWSTLGRIRQLRKSFQSLPKEDDHDNIISLLHEDISSFTLDTGFQRVGLV
ncbi:MAG: F0F1 ATP synthase subunit delta, partial [Clostridia bacterium]|nr:F0F1 ATP synthase subunit delta [Clostridia bacterium]